MKQKERPQGRMSSPSRGVAVAGIALALVIGTGAAAHADAPASISTTLSTQPADIPPYPPAPAPGYPVIQGTYPPKPSAPKTQAPVAASISKLASTGTVVSRSVLWGAIAMIVIGAPFAFRRKLQPMLAWRKKRR